MTERQKLGRIEEMRRMPHSANGNPRWKITLADGSVWRTRKDSQVAYKIDTNCIGRYVTMSLDGKGEVSGVWEAEERRISMQDRLWPPLESEQDENGHWPADPRMTVTVRSVFGGSTIVLDNATSYQDALEQALATPFEVWVADENRDDYGDA